MSNVLSHLQWKIRAYNLLRRTSRPVSTHPGTILTPHEIELMESAWVSGWSPKEFVRILIKSDKRSVPRSLISRSRE